MFGVTKTQRTIRSSRSGRRIFACEKKLYSCVHRFIDDQNEDVSPKTIVTATKISTFTINSNG